MIGNAAKEERWFAVPGYEGFYEVSDTGRVRSIDRYVAGRYVKRLIRGKLLSQKLTNKGYPFVWLGLGEKGKSSYRTVHRLVLEAFVGPAPEGAVACHNNDIQTDNRLENLRWDTRSENQNDIVRNGNHVAANKTHCKRGHEFNEVNTRIRKCDGGRDCRACCRTRNRKQAS